MDYLLERYYPSSEEFFLELINEDDLYDYVCHGFALLPKDGKNVYASYCFTKPLLLIPQTPEADELFRQKKEGSSNISGLIHLLVRIRHILYYKGDNQVGWDAINTELAKKENKETLENFKVTVDNSISRMFPNYNEL